MKTIIFILLIPFFAQAKAFLIPDDVNGEPVLVFRSTRPNGTILSDDPPKDPVTGRYTIHIKKIGDDYLFDADKNQIEVDRITFERNKEILRKSIMSERRIRFRTYCNNQTGLIRDRCEILL